jgi:hypothetical protein
MNEFVQAPLSPSLIAWIVFGVFFVVWAIFSGACLYHWYAYGIDDKVGTYPLVLFGAVSVVCFGVAAISLAVFFYA